MNATTFLGDNPINRMGDGAMQLAGSTTSRCPSWCPSGVPFQCRFPLVGRTRIWLL